MSTILYQFAYFILTLALTGISNISYSEVDKAVRKHQVLTNLSNMITKNFCFEILISFTLLFLALIEMSYIPLIVAVCLLCYNFYVFIRGNYKFDVLIGETEGNKDSQSTRNIFKMKFMTYICLAGISFCFLIHCFIMFLINEFLMDGDKPIRKKSGHKFKVKAL